MEQGNNLLPAFFLKIQDLDNGEDWTDEYDEIPPPPPPPDVITSSSSPSVISTSSMSTTGSSSLSSSSLKRCFALYDYTDTRVMQVRCVTIM